LTGAVVVLSSDSLTDDPVPLLAGLEIPATAALDHAKVAPTVDEVIVYPNGALSHTVAVRALVITAVGLTVTTRFDGVPVQIP
jgi:hypothetical protein